MRDGRTAEAALPTVLAERKGSLAFALSLGLEPGPQASGVSAVPLPALGTKAAASMRLDGVGDLVRIPDPASLPESTPPPEGWAVLPVLASISGAAPELAARRGAGRGDGAAPDRG